MHTLKAVLDRMEKFHLPINLIKSSFLAASTKVLGHIISAEGKSACPEQTASPPCTVVPA